MKNKTVWLTRLLFLVYILVIFWIIVLKFDVSLAEVGTMRNVNLVPYSAPMRINGEIVYSEMFLNVLIFVPFGIYSEMLFEKWNIIQHFFIFLLTSVGFEVLQYLFALGASDITDVIHNVLGGLIGVLLFKGIKKVIKNKRRAQHWMLLLALVVTFIALSLFLFLVR